MDVPHQVDQECAGKEFDNWLDWNGTAESPPGATVAPSSIHNSRYEGGNHPYPVSPSSTAHSDSQTNTCEAFSYVATKPLDLATPEHSSGASEGSHSAPRLSRDPEPEYALIATRPLLKRKLPPPDVPLASREQDYAKPPAKKRPHNVIEKRYRANLNEKIAELRDSVPSLRVLKKTQAGDDAAGNSDDDDLDGLTAGNKLNKASVLTKAVEYIRHLELRNKRLDDENRALKERLRTLDQVLARGGTSEQRAAAFTSQTVIESSSTAAKDSGQTSKDPERKSSGPPQGLIPLPDSWRKFRENQSQEHYGHVYDAPSEGRGHAGKWPTRLMLGTLAGLMIMEGFAESDDGPSSKERGLFGIPPELLDGYRFLASPRVYLAAFSQFCRAGGVVPLVKGFTALTIMAFFVFAYLFHSKPSAPKGDPENVATAQELPSLASPIEVRRRAWSTSMQTLKLPHHHFFSEWLAVTTEWLKYTVRYLFGAQAYAWVTGRSGEDESARVKAWDIAIDAQLAGGDAEVCRSRVVLTSFGSGTLPQSPLRLMLRALHCRLLLWRVGRQSNSFPTRFCNQVATFFARREWRRAQQIHAALPANHPDRLSSYHKRMLSMDCDEILTEAVLQRAYNLMYDRPTSEHAEDALMDVVVEDHAVRSPLDAVAAWRSTQALRESLLASVQSANDGEALAKLRTAIGIAPTGSAAETRALALHAVFYQSCRKEYLARASSAFPHQCASPAEDFISPYFIDSSTPMSARTEISTLLSCAAIMTILESLTAGETQIEEQLLPHLLVFIQDMDQMTLLTFASLHFVAEQLHVQMAAQEYLNLNSILCRWLWTSHPETKHVPADLREKIESTCPQVMKSVRRRMSTTSNDTGYETQDASEPSSPVLSKGLPAALTSIAGDWHV